MRILHVISGIDSSLGGPTAAVEGLARFQREAGLDVRLVATYQPNFDRAVADRLDSLGMPVRLIGPAQQPLMRHPEIPRVLDEEIPEARVVHIHGLWEEVQHRAARLAMKHHVPHIITPHGMLTPWSLASSRLRKRLYLAVRMRRNLNRAAAVHYITEHERETSATTSDRAPSIVEPIGIDLAEFETLPVEGTFRREYPEIADRPLIVFLGRLHPGKRVDLLIRALARLSHLEAMLAVIGPDDDGHRAELEDLAESLGVRDRVIFTGKRSGADKLAALADSDVFALPSDHENFGVAVVEALAAGTPVVISDQVGIHQEITAAGVGVVVARDVQQLTQGLEQWLNDESRHADAASRAREFVREQYDWRAIGLRWRDHYERLAGTAGIK